MDTEASNVYGNTKLGSPSRPVSADEVELFHSGNHIYQHFHCCLRRYIARAASEQGLCASTMKEVAVDFSGKV
jgi:hypothetical protein